MASIYESSFYKLAEDVPDTEEAINRIRYALINYTIGKSTNDGRLFNSVINFIADVVEKFKTPELERMLEFAADKITPNIKSKFLREQSNIALFTSALIFIRNLDRYSRVHRNLCNYARVENFGECHSENQH